MQIFKSKPQFEELCEHEIAFQQVQPNEERMEQDPMEILEMVRKCIDEVSVKLKNLSPIAYSSSDIVAVGITNQRETTVVWDKKTGQPLYNAIGEYRFCDKWKLPQQQQNSRII